MKCHTLIIKTIKIINIQILNENMYLHIYVLKHFYLRILIKSDFQILMLE